MSLSGAVIITVLNPPCVLSQWVCFQKPYLLLVVSQEPAHGPSSAAGMEGQEEVRRGQQCLPDSVGILGQLATNNHRLFTVSVGG